MPPFDTKDYGFVDVTLKCIEVINETVIDWSKEQEDSMIHAGNYTNTTYELASNGNAGLSKYNFNLDRKNKLLSIETGAEVNVRSDWTSESGKSEILNKPTIVDWRDSYVINVGGLGDVQQKIHINNIPDLSYVSNTTFNSYKLVVETSFNTIDSCLNKMSKDITDNYSFTNSVKTIADENNLDISNLDNSFSIFKSLVENSFNIVDSSLNNIILDLSNLDNSFNTFKLSVENSFNLVDSSLTNIILDISTLENSFNTLSNPVDWTIEQTENIHINNIPDLSYVSDDSFNALKDSVNTNTGAIIDLLLKDIQIDLSLNNIILDISNLDNSFNNFKSSVESSFNLVDSSLNNIILDISLIDNSINDIISDISTLDFSFSLLNNSIGGILPTINISNQAQVLTSTGNSSLGAVWAPVVSLTTNDNYNLDSTTGTAASTAGVFNYTQPKIINLEVSNNNYIELTGADLIVNGDTKLKDTSINGILDISGEVYLNGVNLNPSVEGDVIIDASYITVDVCLNVLGNTVLGNSLINDKIIMNGKCGISTSNPTTELDVNGSIRCANLLSPPTFAHYINMNDSAGIKIRGATGSSTGYTLIENNTINAESLVNGTPTTATLHLNEKSNGGVYIKNNLEVHGTQATFNGNITTSGNMTAATTYPCSGAQILNHNSTRARMYKAISSTFAPSMYWGDITGGGHCGFDLKYKHANGWGHSFCRMYTNQANHNGLFQVFSGFYYFGAFGSGSDDRFKHGETIVTDGLSTIRKLVPKTYKKTRELLEADNDGTNIGNEDEHWWWETGLIAQEVELIEPLERYVKTTDGIKTLNYNCIHTHTIAGLKELDAIVTAQAELIKQLENRITILENS